MSVCASCLTSTPHSYTPSLLPSDDAHYFRHLRPVASLSAARIRAVRSAPSKSFSPDSHRHTLSYSLSQATPFNIISSHAWVQVISNTVHIHSLSTPILIPSALPPFSSSYQLLTKARTSCVFTNSFFHRDERELEKLPVRQDLEERLQPQLPRNKQEKIR